ncbi:hypothetical protein Goarm_005954, partial [Gossypium armourianum]|nr:hypothetical protein [Gossypium armourianum]
MGHRREACFEIIRAEDPCKEGNV